MTDEPILRVTDAASDWYVKFHPDGRVEVNPRFNNDEAARGFWEAVESMRPPWAKGRVAAIDELDQYIQNEIEESSKEGERSSDPKDYYVSEALKSVRRKMAKLGMIEL